MNFIVAFGFFAALAGIFLRKLLPVWNTYIPGGLQDTRFLLWNDWWFRYAIDTLHTNPFHTSFLYAPFGTSLILTDSPLWNSLVTYSAQHLGAGLLASANLSFMLSWILAGFATYLLAWEITNRRAPAIVAGLFVMTHSFILSCAMQNWTRFNLYGIPLFLWALVRARRKGRWGDDVLAGITLAWTAACHYYFLVYSFLIWFAIFLADHFPIGWHVSRRPQPGWPLWGRLCLALSAMAGTIGGWIILGHPADIVLGATRIGMETPYNALLVMWTGLLLGIASPWKLQPYRRQTVHLKPAGTWKNHAILVGTAILFLLPLLIPIGRMALHGDYPRQSILWKTHRPGTNLVALLMPNPMHAVWGPAISRWFTSRGMIVQEQAASFGWVFLALMAMSQPWLLGRQAKRWMALGGAATILAMGSYLHVAQWNLWLPLPFYFLRLIPVAGNARIPDHWMTVGAVAWAVVLALALIRLAAKKKWSLNKLSAVVGIFILLENWPGIPLAEPPPPQPVYQTLQREPPGAVLTLPLYIGDSIIGTGDARPGRWIFPWDHLWAQVSHQKPILGGYMGRITRQIIQAYKTDPFIRTLLDLEENNLVDRKPEPALGLHAIQTFKFRYVLVYDEETDPEARRYALASLPLEKVAEDPGIELYRIKGGRSD